MTDHDDELGAFLRSEVPEPGAGYWDGIDSMLQRVEDEQATEQVTEAGPSPTGRHLHVTPPATEEIVDEMQIDDDVIRLTDMTQRTALPSRNRSNFLILAAAAVVVIAGLGVLFSALRSDRTLSVDAADGDGSPATTVPVAEDGDTAQDGDTEGDTAENGDTAQDGDTADDIVALDLAGTRQCYSDGAVALTLDFAEAGGTFTGFQVPVGFAADTEGLTGFELPFAPGGDRLKTIAGTPVSSDFGSHRVSESSIAALEDGFGAVSTGEWTVTPAMVSQPAQVEAVQFAAIDCAEVAEDLQLVESTFPFYPEIPTAPVTITEILTTAGQNRACYNAGGSDVLVFDFTDDRVSANALRVNALETTSATRSFDSDTTFNVATLILGDQENGRDTVRTMLWEITPERITVPSNGEEFPAIDCATVADEVAQTESFLAAAPYPAYPLGS